MLEEQSEHVKCFEGYYLSIHTVEKIIKDALPPAGVRLLTEAKRTVQEFLSEFIVFTDTETIVTCDREYNGKGKPWHLKIRICC